MRAAIAARRRARRRRRPRRPAAIAFARRPSGRRRHHVERRAAEDGGAARRKLAHDSARVPGDRGRFHRARSTCAEAQGGVPDGARLLAHLSAFHRARDLSRDLRPFRRSTRASTARRSTLSRDVNLGIAVDLDHNGLVVPVVRDAGDLTLVGLAKAIRRQIEKAQARQALTRTISRAAPTRSATTAPSARPSPRPSSTRRRSPFFRPTRSA